MDSETSLYRKVVTITYDYLGPAADRFVTRQIRNHLHKDPEELEKSDLKKLIDWISLAFNLLSDDDQLVSDYIDSLEKLVSSSSKRLKSNESHANHR